MLTVMRNAWRHIPVLKPYGKCFSWHSNDIEEKEIKVEIAWQCLDTISNTIGNKTKSSPVNEEFNYFFIF